MFRCEVTTSSRPTGRAVLELHQRLVGLGIIYSPGHLGRVFRLNAELDLIRSEVYCTVHNPQVMLYIHLDVCKICWSHTRSTQSAVAVLAASPMQHCSIDESEGASAFLMTMIVSGPP
jgi:hypothetical protein